LVVEEPMLERHTNRTWWLALCAAAAVGCSAGAATQVVTGHLTSSDAIAVRAVDGDAVITAAKVRADRSFTLELPSGSRYRLEVLTASGVKRVLSADGALSFAVCKPSAPWDIGEVSSTGAPGEPGPPPCDPKLDPTCGSTPPPPPPCDPTTDPTCGGPPCDPKLDPKCGGTPPPPPPPCDPTTDPTCGVPPCDPKLDPTCGGTPPPPPPPPCDPTTDPTCGCPPDDPKCQICNDPTGATCVPPPPPTCDASTDPTCGDPCAIDPMKCGCPKDDPTCWGTPPAPPACDASGTCSPKDGWMPAHPPIDFGCGKSA
jgi:hypothetical protein